MGHTVEVRLSATRSCPPRGHVAFGAHLDADLILGFAPRSAAASVRHTHAPDPVRSGCAAPGSRRCPRRADLRTRSSARSCGPGRWPAAYCFGSKFTHETSRFDGVGLLIGRRGGASLQVVADDVESIAMIWRPRCTSRMDLNTTSRRAFSMGCSSPAWEGCSTRAMSSGWATESNHSTSGGPGLRPARGPPQGAAWG